MALGSRQHPGMIRRHLQGALLRASRKMPVITIIGPRQSGKTTLVRRTFPRHAYLSLERPDVRSRALADPQGLIEAHRGGVVLDEIQRAPELLSYLQAAVDADARPGRYVLTGSQNILLLRGVSQTLAGRTALFRLLPFSLSELHGRPALQPERLDHAARRTRAPDAGLWETVFTGLYPRIHDQDLPPTRWLGDYYRTYVERDVREALRIADLDAFDRFVRLAAARTAQELNLVSLAADVGISQPTAKAWLMALRTSSLVTLLQPHHRSFRKRLRKHPRMHFLDSGLVCYLLGIQSASVLERHPLRGAIFESFVISELVKAFEHSGREAPLFFWRDSTGHEIDLLIDFGDRVLPLEVKSGITVAGDACSSLEWWTAIPENSARGGVLVHGGTDAFALKEFKVLPWFLG
jgi:uncharacterized protein